MDFEVNQNFPFSVAFKSFRALSVNELIAWMRANIKGKWSWDTSRDPESGQTLTSYSFESSQEAMLFKLTFSGK